MTENKSLSEEKEFTVYATFNKQLELIQPRLEKLLSEYGTTPQHFSATAQNLIRSNPKLIACTSASLMGSLLRAAELGLSLSIEAAECDIIPYKGKAQFQMRYGGVVKLSMRTPGVTKIWSEVVHEHDEFYEELGSDPKLIHRRHMTSRGEAIGAYACAKVNNEIVFKYMTKDQVMEIKKLSNAASSQSSPWNTNDPMKWMWQKTVIKQMAKLLPKNESFEKAIHMDNVCERGGHVEADSKGEIKTIEVEWEASTEDKKKAVEEKKEGMKKQEKLS